MDPAYEAEIQAWQRARHRRLTSETGWLTLVDRVTLDPGDNPLPFGIARVSGNHVVLSAAEGKVVTRDGERVDRVEVVVDDDSEMPSVQFEGRGYELLWRTGQVILRVRDPESRARIAFRPIRCFPIDPRWRIAARFTPHVPPRKERLAYDEGAGAERDAPGLAEFELDGKQYTLEPVIEPSSNRWFAMFKDLTNGQETYGAGRFLYIDPARGKEIVLDFNKAFNPPCAVTEFASCPIVPVHNRLAVRIEAGEQAPT